MKYRFGEFELMPAARLLLRNGDAVTLPLRAFECMVHLIEHRDRAVGRDELAQAVWHRDNVSDNQIAQAIAGIRRLIGERGSDGPMLRTVPGFGYHWIGAVEVLARSDATTQPVISACDDAAVDSGTGPAPGAEDGGIDDTLRPRPPWRAMATIVAILVALGLFALHRFQGTQTVPEAETEPEASTSPAWVLPAELPDEADLAWARIALMALVGERLRSHDLPVVPVENVLTHLDADSDVAESSLDELGAARIVRTRASRDGESWRVALAMPDRDGSEVLVHGHDQDLLKAAESATDALALHLGGRAGAGSSDADERLASIRHTVRVGDIDGARTQLARLPAALRDSVQAGLIEVQIDNEQGRTERAAERLEVLFQRVQAGGSDEDRCEVMLARIQLARRSRQPDWHTDVDAMIELAERSAVPHLIARAVNLRGIRNVEAGQFEAAVQDFSSVRRIRMDLGDELGAADAMANLGRVSPLLGNVAESVDRLSRSARVYRRYGAAPSEFQTLLSSMAIQSAALRWQEALASSDRARLLLPHIPDPGKRSTFHRRRATVMLGLGRTREALELMDEADRLLGEARADAARIARANLHRSKALQTLGRLDEALAAADTTFSALDEWQAQSELRSHLAVQGPDLALADWMDARAALMQARPGTTIALDTRHLAAFDRGDSPYALVARGDWLREQGRDDAAEASYRQALADAERSNSLSRILAATEALVKFLLPRDRLEEAGALVDALYARDPEILDRDFDTAVLMLRIRHARGDTAAWSAMLARTGELAGDRELPAELVQAPATAN